MMEFLPEKLNPSCIDWLRSNIDWGIWAAHDNPANGIDTRSVSLVSFNDESGDEADRRYDDDSMSQESSQSLIPHSRTRDLESSIAESSQSIIPHSLEHRLGSTDLNPQKGDLVVVHLRHKGKGRKCRLVTSKGFVIAIDSRDPNRVKTDRCP